MPDTCHTFTATQRTILSTVLTLTVADIMQANSARRAPAPNLKATVDVLEECLKELADGVPCP